MQQWTSIEFEIGYLYEDKNAFNILNCIFNIFCEFKAICLKPFC